RPPGGGKRQAIGQAEGGHDRVDRVVAIGPPADDRQGEVELGRSKPDNRSKAAGGIGHWAAPDGFVSRGARRPRASGPIGPIASSSRIHSPTASVCGRRAGSIPATVKAAAIASPDRGSCRARTLWIVLRRSRRAAWTSRHRASSTTGSRRSSSANGSITITAESTAGAGSNAVGGTRRTIRTVAWYWTNTDR